MNKALIYVEGGNVQSCESTDPNLEIEIFDVDNLRAEGFTSLQIDDQWASLREATFAKDWTVVLLLPDYIRDESVLAGTYAAHVRALSPELAVNQARAEAFTSHELEDVGSPDDYAVVAVYPGHLQDHIYEGR